MKAWERPQARKRAHPQDWRLALDSEAPDLAGSRPVSTAHGSEEPGLGAERRGKAATPRVRPECPAWAGPGTAQEAPPKNYSEPKELPQGPSTFCRSLKTRGKPLRLARFSQIIRMPKLAVSCI